MGSRSKPSLARRAGRKARHVGSRSLQGAAVGAVLGYITHGLIVPGYSTGGDRLRPYVLIGAGAGAGLGAVSAIG